MAAKPRNAKRTPSNVEWFRPPAAMLTPYGCSATCGDPVGRTFLALTGLAAATSAAEPIKNSACLDCHADKTLTKTNAAGKAVSLFVDVAKLAASVHKTNPCASCHADMTAKHPDDNVPAQPANCAVPREPVRELRRQRPWPGPGQRPERRRHLQRLPRRAHHPAADLAGFATAFLAAGRDLRRVPRPGGQRRGGKRAWQGRCRRPPRRADLHRLPFRA